MLKMPDEKSMDVRDSKTMVERIQSQMGKDSRSDFVGDRERCVSVLTHNNTVDLTSLADVDGYVDKISQYAPKRKRTKDKRQRRQGSNQPSPVNHKHQLSKSTTPSNKAIDHKSNYRSNAMLGENAGSLEFDVLKSGKIVMQTGNIDPYAPKGSQMIDTTNKGKNRMTLPVESNLKESRNSGAARGRRDADHEFFLMTLLA